MSDDNGVIPLGCVDSGDTGWVALATILILGMMPALGFFEAGLLRAKNTVSILTQVLGGLSVLSFLWYCVGFSLTFGPDHGGVIGDFSHSFYINVPLDDCLPEAPFVPGVTWATFQMMFAAITPLLITGAFAERLRWSAFLWFTILWEVLIYYPLAHWVWGGGFLAKLGVIDFAGGIVIHTSAGAASLVCAFLLGQRKGFNPKSPEFPASNVPLAIIGGALLWMGWFGFNAGSALTAGTVAASTVITTQIASSASAVVWTVLSMGFSGHTNVIEIINGAIAGLAGITPAAGYVTSQSALVIGIILGGASWGSVRLLKHRWHIDDALDVSSVHGLTGVIGSLAIGFAGSLNVNPLGADGWINGNPKQIWIQLVGVLVSFFYAGIMSGLILKLLDVILRLKVTDQQEHEGLDLADHHTAAYVFDEEAAGHGHESHNLQGEQKHLLSRA